MVARRKKQVERYKFTNEYGEQWEVEIDRASGTGRIRGDDIDGIDGAWLDIDDTGLIAGGFLQSESEYAWLAPIWREATGTELRKPLAVLLREAMQVLVDGQVRGPA